MKKQTPKPYYEAAHYSHRQNVHGFLMIIVFIAALVMAFASCRTPRYGCPNMADLKAHKYDDKYAWLYNHETRLMIVMDKKDGKPVCFYYDSK